MPNENTQKVNLSQVYIYNGRRYGPGEADVPEKAVEALQKKEAAYQEYLRTHDAPAPVTPAINSGERHDPRRKPDAQVQANTPDTRQQSQTFTAATSPGAQQSPVPQRDAHASRGATAAKGQQTTVAKAGDDAGPDAHRAATHAKGAKADEDDARTSGRGHR